MHGREIIATDRYYRTDEDNIRVSCVVCHLRASVLDEQDPDFALCESHLLAWDLKESGLTMVQSSRAMRSWEKWWEQGHQAALEHLTRISRVLALVDATP